MEERPQKTLYEQYTLYKNGTNKGNILHVAPHYFSNNILEKDYAIQPYMADFLLFKESIKNEMSYYEKITDKKGCLVINGYNEKQEPVTLSLRYVREAGQWLVDYVATIYDQKIFENKAVCPKKYLRQYLHQ